MNQSWQVILANHSYLNFAVVNNFFVAQMVAEKGAKNIFQKHRFLFIGH